MVRDPGIVTDLGYLREILTSVSSLTLVCSHQLYSLPWGRHVAEEQAEILSTSPWLLSPKAPKPLERLRGFVTEG